MVARSVDTWTLDCLHTMAMNVVNEGRPAACISGLERSISVELWMTEVVMREMKPGVRWCLVLLLTDEITGNVGPDELEQCGVVLATRLERRRVDTVLKAGVDTLKLGCPRGEY
jgi:hypothetical protein